MEPNPAERSESRGRSLWTRFGETVGSYLPTPPRRGVDDDARDSRASATARADDQRVLDIVDEHGGRVKQATVVAETGWSEAKASRLLTGMEADGRITRYRVGREKVVKRPDSDDR